MILIAGGSGLIGSAIRNHFDAEKVINYDINPVNSGYYWLDASKPLEGRHLLKKVGAFIDCARYTDQKDQVTTWHTVIQHLQRKGAGRMILFSSIYGHIAPDFSIYPGTDIPETPLEYAMSKAAVEQATRFLAQKLKPYNIQVNAIAPGGVLDFQSAGFQYAYKQAGNAPMIEPKNLLPVVDMLLHPDNAVNGQVITVDGGWSL
jgi:NAD(P)-dependent dehydrogenase (short-subunit alcohol dehydrogenase family)